MGKIYGNQIYVILIMTHANNIIINTYIYLSIQISFITNLGTYGPYGGSGGEEFSVPFNGGKLKYTTGRAGQVVDQISFHLECWVASCWVARSRDPMLWTLLDRNYFYDNFQWNYKLYSLIVLIIRFFVKKVRLLLNFFKNFVIFTVSLFTNILTLLRNL